MKHLLLSSLLSIAFAGAAAAQDHAGHGQHHDAHVGHATQTAKAPEKLTKADFERLDADKDGYVSRAEVPEKHPLLEHFPMADKSRDGKLDKREFKLALSML